MSAETNKQSVVVGIFVAVGLLILIAGIFLLGGQQKRFVKSTRIMTVFNDVGGLKPGNNVWFSGVKIGTVKRISFYGKSQVEVDMDIEDASKPYIRKDAKTTISTDGLIGNKIVVITGGTTSQPEVEEGDKLASQEALSPDQILETLQENNKNLLHVTKDFMALVGNIRRGKGTVGAVLTDSVVADNFKRAMVNLEKASNNTTRITASVQQFAAKLNTKGTLANELITDTTVFANLKRTTNRLDAVATSAEKTAGSLNQTAQNFNKASEKLNNANSPLGILLTDQETASNLRNSMKNLREGTQLLKEDLKAAQSNFLLRGYFKKQAKEAAKQVADSTARAKQAQPNQ